MKIKIESRTRVYALGAVLVAVVIVKFAPLALLFLSRYMAGKSMPEVKPYF